MRRSSRSLAIVALLAIAISCDRKTIPTDFSPDAPTPPSFAILDGANGGTAGFYFLPPTVPTTPSFSGVFDATLTNQLRVEVCKLNSAGACIMPAVATLTSVATDPRNAIRPNTVRQFYSVYWYTAGGFAGTGSTLRANVLLNNVRLGFVDFYEPKAGLWLPITFRVETGINTGNPAPAVTINSPTNGTTVREGTGVNLSASATDSPDGDVSASITWSSNLQGALGNGPSLNNVVLIAGTHTISARATDSQGAAGSSSITVTVTPNAPPVVTISAPANDAQFIVGTPVTFTAAAQDPEDGDVAASLTWTSNVAGSIGNGASITASNLALGPHTITATATDSRGRTASATVAIVITPNNSPVIAITAPADNSTFTQGRNITFTATATDAEDGNLAGGVTWTSNRDGSLGTGASITRSNLSLGLHTITASVTDANSNTSTASITINVVANQPPTLSISSPSDNASFALGTNVTFNGSASDAEAGSLTANIAWSSNVSGPVGTGGTFTRNDLALGTHIITASITDTDGATTTATVTITITNTDPTVSITEPADNTSVTHGTSVTFTGTAQDAEDGSLSGAISWTSNIGGALGTGASITTATLAVGTHTITASVTDAYGAPATASITLIVTANNTPPGLIITLPANGFVHQAGTPLAFSGTASDAEDGNLGAAIQWSSDRQGFLGTGANISVNLNGGTHIITASVTDAGNLTATATITVVISIVTVPTTLNVPYGGSASLPITLSEPAPAGGLTFVVTTSNPAAVGVQTTTVTIAGGQQSANATLLGTAPGVSTVTVSNPSYGSDASQVSTTANLNIIATSISFPLNVTPEITVRLESNGAPIAAPAGGITVDLIAANTQCVASQQVTIPAGLVSTNTNLAYGGSATLPCSTTITASTPGVPEIGTDNLNATVNPAAPITNNLNGARIGSGLQSGAYAFTLGAPAPAGGASVTIASSDAALLRVSPNGTTASTASIILNLAAGQTVGTFWVQGMEGVTGGASVNFTASGYVGTPANVQVVAVAMDITNILTTTTALSPNDPFQVRVGAINTTNNGFYAEQEVRIGGTPLTFTLTNSNATVAQLVTSALTGQTVTVTIPVGSARTAATVAAGGVELDLLGGGSTTVTAANPTVIPLAGATQTVAVNAPSITSNVNLARVGSGLQSGAYSFTLGAPAPVGGVSVTVSSSDGALLRIAPNATTAGSTSIIVNVAAGATIGTFWIQGMENVTGPVAVSFSALGYVGTPSNVQVVAVVMELIGVTANTTTLSLNDVFQIRVGAINATNNGFYAEQEIRNGGTPLIMTVTNSNALVGQLTTTAATGQSVTVTIPVGAARTATTIAGGGIAFDPLNSGSTTIAASNASVTPLAGATQTINVSAPSITSNANTARIGSGLQSGVYSFTLGAPAPTGGVSVTVSSSNAALLRVAPNATTAGTASITVNVAAGATTGTFWLQAMEGVTGPATVNFAATGFTGTPSSVQVTVAVMELIGVNLNTTTLSLNDPFQVRLGAMNTTNNGFYAEQQVRAGGAPFVITVTNSNAGVGQLVTTALTGQTVTATIPIGSARTATTVAAGGVDFDPLGIGATTVTASNPNVTPLPGAAQTINVSAPGITSNVNTARVGSGLQAGVFSFTLGAPAPTGGLSVTITSSAPSVLAVSPNATTAGTTSIIVNVPAGQTIGNFWIQGLENQTGSATLTFTASGFTNGSANVDVVAVGVEIIGLVTSIAAGAANDPFQVRLGAINATNNGFYAEQSIRAGGTALTITVTNSNAAVGQLVTTAATAQSVSVSVPVGSPRSATTVALGGVAFDPQATGSSTVSASATGIVSLPAANVGVIVN